MIKTALYEMDITPNLGCNLPGYFHRKYATKVLDKLYVRAFVVDDNNNKVALVTVDSMCICKKDADAARKRAYELCGIKPQNIMITASHIHSGGPIVNHGYDQPVDEEYTKFLANRIADTISLANQRLSDSNLSISKGELYGYSFIRIYEMKYGGLKTNPVGTTPGTTNPDIIKPYTDIDPQVLIIKVMHGDSLKGILVNFACHCDVVGKEDSICADFPGQMVKRLKEEYGHDVVVMFIQGACGNINHVNPYDPETLKETRYIEIGDALADKVKELMKNTTPIEDINKVNADKKEVTLPLGTVTKEYVDWASEVINRVTLDMEGVKTFDKDQLDLFYAQDAVKIYNSKVKEINTDVQVLSIGDIAIFAYPGEPFVEYGNEIKKSSPFKYNMVAAYSNDYIGYIPVEKCMVEGVYEYRPKHMYNHDAISGEIINKSLLDISDNLSKEK